MEYVKHVCQTQNTGHLMPLEKFTWATSHLQVFLKLHLEVKI